MAENLVVLPIYNIPKCNNLANCHELHVTRWLTWRKENNYRDQIPQNYETTWSHAMGVVDVQIQETEQGWTINHARSLGKIVGWIMRDNQRKKKKRRKSHKMAWEGNKYDNSWRGEQRISKMWLVLQTEFQECERSRARFSWMRTLSSVEGVRSRDRVLEAKRILERKSCVHFCRSEDLSSDDWRAGDGWIMIRRRSRARIGARERKERKTSFKMRRGLRRREEMDSGVGEGLEATVWRISPI